MYFSQFKDSLHEVEKLFGSLRLFYRLDVYYRWLVYVIVNVDGVRICVFSAVVGKANEAWVVRHSEEDDDASASC